MDHHCLFHALGAAGYEPAVDPQPAIAGVWGHEVGLEVAPGFGLRVMGSQHSHARWELHAYRHCMKLGKSVPKIIAH